MLSIPRRQDSPRPDISSLPSSLHLAVRPLHNAGRLLRGDVAHHHGLQEQPLKQATEEAGQVLRRQCRYDFLVLVNTPATVVEQHLWHQNMQQNKSGQGGQHTLPTYRMLGPIPYVGAQHTVYCWMGWCTETGAGC